MTTTGKTGTEPRRKERGPGQVRALLRASHPRHALALALAIGVLARISDRPWRETVSAFAAMLVVQLMLGLVNDLTDEKVDRQAKVPGKPLATGDLARGNATYAVAVLLLLAVPLSLQNGGVAASVMLAILLVGAVHNRFLHRTVLSWVGWVATFALLPAFLAYGSWPGRPHGEEPSIWFTVAAAALGLCLHFLTTLPDLVPDHASGSRSLPLRIALKTGAPRLFYVSIGATLLATAGLVVAGLTVGLRQ